MKKKKILKFIPILVILLMISAVYVYNMKDVHATACVKTVTYYFLEGKTINAATQNQGTPDQTTNPTTFAIPNYWTNVSQIEQSDIKVSGWSASDAQNYFEMQYNTDCQNGNGVGEVCSADGKCLNSGTATEGNSQWDCGSLSKSEGSGGLTIGGGSAADFIDNYVINGYDSGEVGSADATVDFSYNSETNKIDVNVVRNYEVPVYNEDATYWNGETMYMPLKVEVTYEYETTSGFDCDGNPIPPDDGSGSGCIASGSGSSITNTNCGSSNYSAAYSVGLSGSYDVPRNHAADDCGTKATETVSAIGMFTESGTLNARPSPSTQYAGGSFTFTLSYSGTATWSICNTPSYSGSESYCVYDDEGNCASCATEQWSETRDQAAADNKLAELAASQSRGFSANSPSVLSRDSNNEKDESIDQDVGVATGTGPDSGNWPEGTTKTSSVTFSQNHACIDLRERTVNDVTYPAYVEYKGTCDYADPNGTNGQKDGGNLYYIPLKYKDGGMFPVVANSNGKLNILTKSQWKFELECNVNVYQKLYETNDQGVNGYKFIYRPIDMSNPFPNNREPGDNWLDFWYDQDAKTNKLNRNDSGLEYSATLTASEISKIKDYNDSKIYPGLGTISNSGKSSFLGTLGITNQKGANNYNSLGECDNGECW